MIKKVFKKILRFIKNRFYWYISEPRKVREEIKKAQKEQKDLKVVVGAGGSGFDGWTSTDRNSLNLLREKDWHIFKENSISALLAEHVWEHFTSEEGEIAASICYTYLKKGGYLRIAVPDSFCPSKKYQERVRPGGIGEGADDHKEFYSYKTLTDLLKKVGFSEVRLCEYYDESGVLHDNSWRQEDGPIERTSRHFWTNESNQSVPFVSLIVDAVK